jgi:hypothetical protein
MGKAAPSARALTAARPRARAPRKSRSRRPVLSTSICLRTSAADTAPRRRSAGAAASLCWQRHDVPANDYRLLMTEPSRAVLGVTRFDDVTPDTSTAAALGSADCAPHPVRECAAVARPPTDVEASRRARARPRTGRWSAQWSDHALTLHEGLLASSRDTRRAHPAPPRCEESRRRPARRSTGPMLGHAAPPASSPRMPWRASRAAYPRSRPGRAERGWRRSRVGVDYIQAPSAFRRAQTPKPRATLSRARSP